jgi:hypothetical protein
MRRRSLRYVTPLALVLGMLLARCSSQAADVAAEDAGAPDGSSGARRDSGRDAGTDARSVDAGNVDAACMPPEGGATCTPGFVACGDAACAVPANLCCETASTSMCQVGDAACNGTHVECEEKTDCKNGRICCLSLATEDNTTAVTSCQAGPTCPTAAVASAQLCRSNAECPNGQCQFWICPLRVLESCTNPNPTFCMAE